MFRSFADVQTAEMLDLPRPRLEGERPHVVACPMSDDQRSLQAGLVARYERDPQREGRPPRGQRAWPSRPTAGSSPSTPGCSPRGARRFPGSKVNALVENVVAIWERTGPTQGHAARVLRHGRAPDPVGYSVYDEVAEKLVRLRHPRGTDRRDRRRRQRREEAGPLRTGPGGDGPGPDRQHSEDGDRDQRPEAARRPPPPRRPVEAGRGRAAGGPDPPAGERERGGLDLPLRDRGVVRRLHVAGAGDQGPVHRPGDDRGERASAGPRTSAARSSRTPR